MAKGDYPTPTDIRRAQNKRQAVVLRGQGMSMSAIARSLGISLPGLNHWMKADEEFHDLMHDAVQVAVHGGARVTETAPLKANAATGASDTPTIYLRPSDPQANKDLKARRKIGFEDFRRHYFGYETYSHQKRMVDAIEEMDPRDIAMILVWPESGKTTTLTDWICWRLAIDPNLRITYVSESMGLAKKVLGQVKQRMTDTRMFGKYIQDFGPFADDTGARPWTQDHITVAQAEHDERDFSLECRAWNSAAYGTRIDILVVDDVQSLKGISQTDSIVGTLRATYLTRGKYMQTVFIGTRIAGGDVYETFLNIPDLINTNQLVVLRAMDSEGNPTVPEMWQYRPDKQGRIKYSPREFLELMRKQVGEPAWWASYMQNPNTNTLATFTEEMVANAKDPLRDCSRMAPGDYVALSLDPALGGGNALMAMAFRTDHLDLLDLDTAYNLSRVEDILDKVESFAARYHPTEVVIEEAAFQKALVNDERLRIMGDKYGFRIIPHTTTRNKSDPVLGVATMAGSFMRKEIRIPFKDAYAQDRFAPLINQMRAWRPNVAGKLLTQDAVMALWFGWRRWMEFSRHGVDLNAWNRNALPWQPTNVTIGIN